MAGVFISFEGGEGAGKTTQIKRIAEALTAQGHEVVTTREPGGTPEGDKVRSLLVNSDGGNWSPEAEVMLFFVSRAMHVRDLIIPALNAGKIILCDRFTDSTRVYQCAGRGLGRAGIEQVKEFSIGMLEPDLTLIMDLPVSAGLARAKSRASSNVAVGKAAEDRFENVDIAFHERLRHGYLDLAAEYPNRCKVINVDTDLDTVTVRLLSTITTYLATRDTHLAVG
ncbi:MAG: dTMP kinase [Pseudomonadota bacterium]